MDNDKPIKLRIPDQDLDQFSLFELNTESAHLWAASLPVANTRLVVQQLRAAMSEMNRVTLPPDTRFNILEVLRSSLLVSIAGLSRKYLNQPLVLPEEPRQQAELANTLYTLTTTGYTIVALETIAQRESLGRINPARLVCKALHRAIEFCGKKIMQSYQLYQTQELYTWLELHQLYALAERQQLANLPLVDEQSDNSSIAQIYLRTIMLACSKPNQLRQSDLAIIDCAMGEWKDRLKISASGEGLFKLNLGTDHAPVYSSVYKGPNDAASRHVDSSALVTHMQHLQELDNTAGKPGVIINEYVQLPSNILEHLINSLGTMSTRNFARAGSADEIVITVGLSNTHYFVGNELTFEELLNGPNTGEEQRPSANPFMVPPKRQDTWEAANPHEESQRDTPEANNEDVAVDDATLARLEDSGTASARRDRHQAFPVHMVDASPGGYCLEWPPELPGDIKTGDIVGVRDNDKAEWVVAVTRWVSQLESAKTLIGVELLSPRAMPYGARVIQTSGKETELMRVLLLPEIQLVGQPHTLITPRTGFRESQKVSLVRDGEQFYIQLLRQVAASGSYAQFDFRYIKLLEEVIAEDKSGSLGAAYDSLWTNI